MALSHDLISQFAKITKDKTQTKKETTVYGTIVNYGGSSYVKLDGSDLLTPATLTVEVKANDRVTVLLKNHTATVTGNITSPSAQVDSVTEVKNAVVDSVKTDQLNAATARISALEADNATINNKLTATEAEIANLKVGSMDADTINATFATITALNSVSASLNVLDSNFGSFKTLTTNNFSAVNASIASLQTDKLSATDIEGKYANIDFSNISKATMGEFYANSGLIQNVVVGDATISGNLVGVTISGDLIEGNTVKAEKLIIKGSDGLYYKLNTDGMTTEAQQTDQNSLNGSVIKAKSITATKISVTDLVAFGATIGGFKITENSLYSGVKSSVTNTTKGIYLGNDGQIFIGDATNYLKYITDANGNSKLYISADSITFGANKSLVTELSNASKTATNFMNLTAADGLIVGDRTGTLGGNIQLKSETSGASVSLRNGTTILARFISTNKAFAGVTSATTSASSDTETIEDDSGTASETTGGSSQTVVLNQSATVTKIESVNPVYFSGGIRTDNVTINDSNFISNTDFTLNGKIFDKDGRSVLDLNTIAGNLTLGYGRFKTATASSNDCTIVYGNRVRLTTKKGAVIALDGSVVLDAQNANGNMVLGYHLYKKKTGDTNIYAGDDINLRGKSVDIIDSTGNACFEAKNNNGNTVIGYARYVNSGNTNIYGGTELNLFAKSGGAIIANSPFMPDSNAKLALGKAGSLGWSNIYIGNESGVYNGLRMIVGGSNENLCGRDEDGRYIFGNNGSIMYYRAKDVGTTNTGNAFKFTSGNDIALNNTTSVWLFGGADSTSRFIGSYMAYNRTYSSAGNMYVTANGIFGRSSSSSSRYKEDITVADLSCFSGLYNLPVKKYKYKSGYLCGEDERCGQYLYGFIAEDLVNVLPCAVEYITNEEGEKVPDMWNINIIVPSMLKLIQDLNTRLIAIGGSEMPSFYNPNLIDNPDFLINQRAVSGTITTEGYFVDRWKLTSGSVTINDDGSLTLNGTIVQILEKPVGTNVIASASAGTATYNNETATFTLTGSNVNVSWVKLEIGSVATIFVAPNPATELSKCQRYFMRLDFGIPLYAGATNATTLRFALTLPDKMRLQRPTLTMVPITGDSYTWRMDAVDGSTNNRISVTTPPVASLIRGNHTINMTLTFSDEVAFTVYHMYGLYGAGGQYFDISADL